MKRTLFYLLIFIGIVGCNKPKEETTTSGAITAFVSEPYVSLVQQEADEFHRIYPEAQVNVQMASTREAIVKMINEGLRCIVVDRRLNDEEQRVIQQAGLKVAETVLGDDAFAIVVHKANTIPSLSPDMLKAIVLGKIARWQQIRESKQFGNIELALTGKNSGSYELLMRRFFKANEEATPFVLSQSQTQSLEYVAAHPYSLSIIPYVVWNDTTNPQQQALKKNIRVLEVLSTDSTGAVVSVKLHQTNIYNALYPLKYPLYVYTASKKAGVAEGFATFMATTTGQKIILNAGLVPAHMPYRVVQLTQE